MNPDALPLRDIHLPAEIGWWPLATGWWVAIALVTLLALAAVGFWLRERAKLRRLALQEISSLRRSYQDSGNGHAFLVGLSTLLRRVMLSVGQREHVAASNGQDWLAYLTEHGGELSSTAQRTLVETTYARPGDVPAETLRELDTFADRLIRQVRWT